jgi:Mce-associated membrane protein
VAGTRNPAAGSPSAGSAAEQAPRPAPRPSPRTWAEEAPTPAVERVAPIDVADTAVLPVIAPEEPEAERLVAPAVIPESDYVAEDEADVADASPAEAPKASPRRKIRDGGIRKPVSLDEVDTSDFGNPPVPAEKRKRSPYLLAGVLVVVGLLLAGLAVFFRVNENGITESTSNTALLDVARTAQVKDQVSAAAESLFSYDFNNIAKTQNAAKDLLQGADVTKKYNALMGDVQRLAPAQKMVVTCKVTRSGVISLNGDLARVMLFIDQTSTRTDTKQTTAGSAQLHVNAQFADGKWKITDMDTYVAPAPPAGSAPSSAPASPAPSK